MCLCVRRRACVFVHTHGGIAILDVYGDLRELLIEIPLIFAAVRRRLRGRSVQRHLVYFGGSSFGYCRRCRMADTEILETAGDVAIPVSGSVRLNNNCISKDTKVTIISESRELKSAEIQTCSIETQTMINGSLENGIDGIEQLVDPECPDTDQVEDGSDKVRDLQRFIIRPEINDVRC